MLNYVMLFGKIKEDPVLIKDKNDEDIINLEVEVPYKDGEKSELITVKLTNGIAQRTMQDLHKGDDVGIKGIVKTNEKKEMEIIVDKLTYFSKSKETNENETGILER